MADLPKKIVRTGYSHIAFSVGNIEIVDALTAELKADGYEVISGPRTTGDGYYESCIVAVEDNQIEIQFMLGQIVSNAIKYSSDSPMLTISMIHSETADVLSVEDNGIGVKKYDLPYIFQKGFTGDSTDSRKKATGIGLYLVKKMADDLNLRLEAASPWEKGFKIVIFFPKLRSNGGK